MNELIEVEIANLQSDVDIDEELVDRVVRFTLEAEEVREAEVSIAFVTEDEIERLNRDYRGVDGPTDVLSFLYHEMPLSGEIIFAPEYIRKQAADYGVSFERELIMLIIHGVLHLLGYDHEEDEEKAEEMWSRQREIEKEFLTRENIS